MNGRVSLVGVVEIVRREQPRAGPSRDIDQVREHGVLVGEAVVLQLDEEVVGTEDLAVLADDLRRLLDLAL